MAINKSNISAQPIDQNYDFAVRMLTQAPTGEYLEVGQPPNTLCGFYSAATDTVQLYIVDATGRRFVPVS